MSDEERAVLEIELNELIEKRVNIIEEWADGDLTYEEAKAFDAMYAEEIRDLLDALAK